MTQINYYLRPTSDRENSLNSYNKILEYFMSFVGDIEVKKEPNNSAIIYYIGTPTIAFIKLEKTGQITVTISNNDNVTINLINNQAISLGFRVYNAQLNCYLPNDVNLYDLTTIKVDTNIKNVLNLHQLTPLFQYRDTLIFFCKNQKNEVVLVNRHYLEYVLMAKLLDGLMVKELYTVVAPNIATFIALFDRGLISLTNPNSKIINLSGFDINNLPKNTKLNFIRFDFDSENQSFTQTDTLEKIPKKYMALKIGQDYTYSMIDGKLTKILNCSVFLISNP